MADEIPFCDCYQCGDTIFVGEPIIVFTEGRVHQECWHNTVETELKPKLIFAGEDE